MLSIKPIQDKEFQKQAVTNCGGIYDAASFAYIANECSDDGKTIRFPIGACQFSIHNNRGNISLLRPYPDVKDDEALMIMARAATAFLFRCGICFVEISPDSADTVLIESLGFKKNDTGLYELDILRYYTTPCHDR